MSDNTILNTNVTSGDVIATEDIGGIKHELVKVEFGVDGVATKVSATDPLPVTGTVTVDTSTLATSSKQDTGNSSLASIDGKLTNPLPISGVVTTGGLTDTQLRASAVPVSGTVTATATDLDIRNLSSGTDSVAVTGTVTANTGLTQPLTDTQLRANPVPVSGTVSVDTTGLATDTKQDTGNASLSSIDTKLTSQATASKQDTGNASLASIDGKLTNPLPVSGTVTTGGLTDTQLRATPVPISGTVTAIATNLDVRDLVFATDKVDASGTVLGASSAVIGHVIADSGSTTAVTGNVTVVQGTGTNLHAVIDSGSTTAVTQATGTNLHTVVDSGTITTVSTVTAVTAISNALPAGNNNIGDVDVATLPALAAGSAIIGNVRIDQTTPGTTNNVTTKDLPDAASTYALTNVSSTAYEASHVLKNAAGYLFMVIGYNSRTSSQFIQLHNSTTVPADTAVPVLIFVVTGLSNFSLDLSKYGRYFSTGIAICNSSTGPTKTVGSSDCWFDAQVI